MNKSGELDNILDDCLERLLTKGETAEQCLESYPERADELKPLLQTALAAKKASAIQPRPEFKARARYEFQSALQTMPSKRSLPSLFWQPRWATAVITVLVLLLAGGSTAAAATNSMPDTPLYQVKLATEQVQLALTPSDIGKAQILTNLADRRVTEIIYLANQGNPGQIEKATQRLDTYLARVVTLTTTQEEDVSVLLAPAPTAEAPKTEALPGPSGQGKGAKDSQAQANRQAKLKTTVANNAVEHPEALRAALETAPESAKPALRRAIDIAEARYGKALETLD